MRRRRSAVPAPAGCRPPARARDASQAAAVKWHRKGRIQPSSTSGTTLGAMAHRLRPAPGVGTRREARREAPVADRRDEMRARIEAYPWPPRRGGVEVVRANRGYTLYSRRTGGPVARLRPTGQGDRVQVLWRRRDSWAAPGDFGPVILPLDAALDFIASEGFFWINA